MVEDGELDHAAHIGHGSHHEEGDLHQDLHQLPAGLELREGSM